MALRRTNVAAGRDFRELMWVAIPKSLAGILQLLFNFILIRALEPEAFGVLSVCLTAIILSDAVLGPSFDLGVLRTAPQHRDRDPARALRIQKTALILKLASLLAIAVPVILAAKPLARWLFHTDSGAPLLVLSALAVGGLGLLRSIQVYFQIERKFEALGISDLIQSVIKFGGIAVVIAITPSPLAVIGLHLVAPLCISIVMLSFAARPLAASSFDWNEARELWKKIRLYAATTALGSTVSRMDVFFVSTLAGTAQAGIFSAANTFALIPQLLGMYMSVVFTPRIMPMWNQGLLGPAYRSFQLWLGIGCVILLVLTPFIFPAAAGWLLPSSFAASVPVFLVLLPAALCSLLNFPWTISFLMFFRPRTMMAFDLAGFPILIFMYWWAVGTAGAVGAAAVTTGFALVKTVALQSMALSVLKQEQFAEKPV